MFSNPQGKPGVVGNYVSQPREVFYSGREFAQFWAPPLTVDGTLSDNPQNYPYDWLLFAGTLMGRVTATGKYATSVLGQTTVAYTASATSLTTDLNTAREITRRIGASGTFKVTGPRLALSHRPSLPWCPRCKHRLGCLPMAWPVPIRLRRRLSMGIHSCRC